MRNETRRRIRLWFTIVGIGLLIGPLINYVTYGQSVDSLLRGALDGAIVAALVSGYAQFVREPWLQPYLKRLNFSVNVLVNAFMYLLLFNLGRVLSVSIHSPGDIGGDVLTFLVDPQIMPVLPVFFLIAVFIEFTLQMNRLIGHNVLWYFLAGTYHRPKEEERIFMFLDLRDSTTMAEQMGGRAYYDLLELFVNALTEPVLATSGEIHEYVGDEVVITWKMKVGLRNGNCLRCFFLIEDALNEMAGEFERRFSRQPRFRAGMHGGAVIAGELGDIKRDIVFVGDIMNTSARLEEYAKKNNRKFVVSEAVIDQIALPGKLTTVHIGDHQPRGKSDTVKLYEVLRREKDSPP